MIGHRKKAPRIGHYSARRFPGAWNHPMSLLQLELILKPSCLCNTNVVFHFETTSPFEISLEILSQLQLWWSLRVLRLG